ncbi:XPG N-terminal domain containing protein [Trichomonas vaginalis G3]|uniref:XPG N-terminal domain containing protein n=1 Tax=Trichomonas vaginalis (strain ATCC PRA-98 / G3) TaxID=412133 RepID=A2E2N7_TRIV3|nr:5'-3' exodeoxyribonuclease protein [Trichomonas vaginalis G3]EAY13065.1 XPG N-terminal domain containing protein [Trichomonas vaginalis G3]KAI5548253.1 5'-3' exodeoxyribonuclease protein [Trichomonas vaginalis G3]|eukprot:XP_001325288.1 XPG N-terminal domain containing protein [Trichomonas vaginalis G3]
MGITGLLSLIHPVLRKCKIGDFKGKTAGVDGFVWLHRGCISCAKDIAKNLPCKSYISFFMKRAQMLIDNGIKPIIVFDGRELPAKIGTNEKRRALRNTSLQKADELERRGLSSEAYEYYKKAIDISPQVLFPLFKSLRKKHIDFFVAPYEADAQLSYLARNKICDFVITEDSDLIPYECPLTIFRLDSDGNCDAISYADLINVPILKSFTPRMILEACVLSGCDYLPSAPNFGIRTAFKLVGQTGSGQKAIDAAERTGKVAFPPGYRESFDVAVSVFRQQKVFDPRSKITVPCFEAGNCELAGEDLDTKDARNLAIGLLNPRTLEPFEELSDDEDSQSPAIPRFNITATESARRQFKSHFGEEEVPLRTIKVPQLSFEPKFIGKKCVVPTSFTPPSRRMLKK